MPFRLSGYEGEEAWTLVYRHEAKVSKSDKTGPQEAAESTSAVSSVQIYNKLGIHTRKNKRFEQNEVAYLSGRRSRTSPSPTSRFV